MAKILLAPSSKKDQKTFKTRIQRASGIFSILTLALVVIAVVATTQLLRQEATESRKAQLALADIRDQLDQENSIEAQVMGDPAGAGPLIKSTHSLDDQIFAAVNHLKAQHVPTSTIENVRRNVASYQQSLNSSYSILLSGNRAQAREIDRSVTRPSYNILVKTLDDEKATLGQVAERRDHISTYGTLGTMAVGVAVCILIVWQLGRGRRIADQQFLLRRSEERFRSLLHNASDVIVVTNQAGIIQYVTPPTRTLIVSSEKVEEIDSTEGLMLANFVHLSNQETFEAVLANNAKQTSTSIFEWKILRRDGTWCDCECLVVNLLNNPNVEGIVFTFRDISERKLLEIELRQSQKLEAVGRLAGGIAHEINTPIQYVNDNVRFLIDSFEVIAHAVNGYRQIAHEKSEVIDESDEVADLDYMLQETPSALKDALKGIERVSHIVKSMKAFGHPGSSSQEMADINETLSNTLVVANSEIRDVADVKVDFGEIPSVKCYASELNQVWLNLLVNAAHAIDDVNRGRGTITVRTYSDNDNVTIEISDTGNGVPDHVKDHIFEPFFTTKDVGRGTGQGLSLARSTIVERHHGTIAFETEIGVGTTFIVRLPVRGA